MSQNTTTAPPRAIPTPIDRPGLSGGNVFALLLSVALIMTAWWSTFAQMWYRWFPGWDLVNESLSKRMTEGDSYYTHGPMVPLVSLFIAFMIHRRVGVPCNREAPARFLAACIGVVSLFFIRLGMSSMGEALGQWLFYAPAGIGLLITAWLAWRGGALPASLVGGLLLAGALGLHLLSVYARVMFVSGFALVGTLAALTLIWGGWSLLRAYWLPIVFLLFMIPLPMEMIARLNFQLKFLAGETAVWATNSIFGVPAFMSGSFISFTPEPDGTPKTLVVENVCSGLRSLISLICFASLFALVCRAKGFWRIVMLLLAVPVAVFCNVVRITFLNLIAHYHSVEMAGPDSTLHNLSGMLVFALALALLFGVEQLILLAGRLLMRDWSDERLLGYLDALPKLKSTSPAFASPAVLLVLAVTAGVSIYWSRQIVAVNISDQAQSAVPRTLVIDGHEYGSEDLELDQKTLTILETNDYIYRRFNAGTAARVADLLIVFSANNRKGTHPPEVCLEGVDQQIISKRDYNVKMPRTGTVRMRELVTQNRGFQAIHLYVYKCGDAYTPDFTTQQATIFLNGLMGRNTAGALIRYTVDVRGHDMETARQIAVGAAEASLPIIDERLP